MRRKTAGRHDAAGSGNRLFLKRRAAAGALALWVMMIGGARADLKPVDLATAPMFSRMKAPPANIMILLDDSGSMTWEILVEGKAGGLLPKPFGDTAGYAFVFDEPGDDLNVSGPDWDYLGAEGRKIWKSRYYRANVLYYNPNLTYSPWPGYGDKTFSDADPHNPRVHPVLHKNNKLKLDDTSFAVGAIEIPHSHYFEWSQLEDAPYLVVMNGKKKTIDYYRFEVAAQSDPLNEKITQLTRVSPPPVDVVTGRSCVEERRNFANWFSYHRRREFVAKASLAQVLQSMESVRVGIYGINQKVVLPLAPVKIVSNGRLEDRVDTLLDKIYECVSWGATPLNSGLNTIGAYFRNNDGRLGGKSGARPYGSAAEGGACQQSFTIVVTDGYYTDPGAVRTGNIDGDDNENRPYKRWGGGSHPYADPHAHTLADIAMLYYAQDLQTDLDDKLPVNKLDSARHQHMVTFGVAFGVNGSLDPSAYDAAYCDSNGNPVQWPAVPSGQTPQTIDDLWHATVNGRGQFFSAKNPEQLAEALTAIMKAIIEIAKGASSSVAVNGDWLFGKLGPNTRVYQPTFSNKDGEWTGDIKAFELDPVTGEVLTDSVKWSAADQLADKVWNERLIATTNGGGVPFAVAYLSADQAACLGPDPVAMIRYLRGREVSNFRRRTSKLGDLVNARPVFFEDVVYAGANDGMLHAFDADSGEERFAYIPNLLFPVLKELADPAYDHRFYVDLTPSVKKGVGIFGGAGARALLVGGLRGGGKGYFALDITDAKKISSENTLAGRVRWEYPTVRDDDMGYSYSRSAIVKSNSSAHRWVVIFGNGYNSVNGSAVLYVLDAADGTVVRKIDTLARPPGNRTANGLSTPIAVDVTYDQKVDFVYAGDLYGNLWKFDLVDSDPADWSVAFGGTPDPQPLFQAKGPGGSLQPITTRPDVMYHPEKHGLMICFGTGMFLGDSDIGNTDVQTIYGIWDYGDRVYDLKTDSWSPDDNSEYLGAFERGTGGLSNQPATVRLLQQTHTDVSAAISGRTEIYRIASSHQSVWKTVADTDNPASEAEDLADNGAKDPDIRNAGYYMDLNPGAGERIVSDVIIRGGILVAIGFTPGKDICSPGGSSMFMELDVFSGGNLAQVYFDITGEGDITAADQVDIGNDPNNSILKIPTGVLMDGHLQMPAFQRLNQFKERLYLSSSRGSIPQLVQRSLRLGVTYWMQVYD